MDAIVSSCLLEHLDDATVEGALEEMGRVLRPGGVMVHFFDIETTGPFWGWAKRQPWFQNLFVDGKGHWGLRPLLEWERLFHKAGFAIQGARLSCRTWVQDLSVWAALDEPLVKGVARFLGRTATLLRRLAGPGGDVVIATINDLLDPLFPKQWAAKGIVRLQKK